MPNHITTIVTGPQQALASLLDDAGKVDFSFLVPPPVNIETGGCSHGFTFGERVEEQPDGTICWYAWNVNNWGTKWNAYDSEVTEGRVQFDTAWSHPYPVMKALAAKHPDVEFEVQYADEDLGSNLGHYKLHGDEVIEYPVVDPLEFASHVKYGQSYAELQADDE